MNTAVNLVLSGRFVVTTAQADVLEKTSVAIAGDTIVAIGPDLVHQYPQAEHIDEPHGLIMPGMINTHTHAAMSCFRGLADDLPLMTWLEKYIFPVEAKLTSDMVYTATLLSICEMIKSGTTTFNDMYLFANDVARAASVAGMRAWLGEVVYDFPSPCYGALENGFQLVEQMFADYADHELITVTVNPHAVYTCSPELLQQLGQVADAHQALYHIHLSENQDEVNTCQQRYGASPVQHLDNLGLLTENVVAAHCVRLTDSEISLLAEQGVKVSHCQESNMKLASGTAPVVKMLEHGLEVGIGTDGSASNNDVDMFGEMNSVAKIHKVARMDPTAMDAPTTLHTATQGGASLLGAGAEIGGLEVGKKADIIVLDMNQPHLTPVYNPVSHLVYVARGSDVIHSVINGQLVMKNRCLQTLNEPDILAEMTAMGKYIRTLYQA